MKNNSEKQKGNRIALSMLSVAGALILLLFSAVSLGWFTSNKYVEDNSMGLTATKNPFELGSENKPGSFDGYLSVNDGYNLQNVPLNGGGSINLTATGEGKPEVKWLMSNTSNFGNLTDKGIEPGSSGMLTFYVIPCQNTSLNLRFTLDMALYDSEAVENADNSTHIIPDSEAVTDLIKGHVLFFREYDEINRIYSQPITEEGFTLSINNANKDTAYRVDFYWIWPLFADQIILPENDALLRAKGYKRIIPDGLSLISETNLPVFFADSGEITYDMIESVSAGSGSAAFNTEHYNILNGKWNEADQLIGTNAGYIELKLTADLIDN